jgi:ribosomal-protein-alanine N-acetyltransferase
MSAIERHPDSPDSPDTKGVFSVRPLTEQDILQSGEIEREAFPTSLPLTSFRRELRNRMASYLVAWRRDDAAEGGVADAAGPDRPPEDGERTLVRRLVRDARSLWPGSQPVREQGQQLIAGFLGMWYMADDAHIVSIGVRRRYRGQGVGELLLIGGIEQAMSRSAMTVTLEVRISNFVARSLYEKYGFKEQGLRKGYYTDNREDAVIMTTDPIQTARFCEQFRRMVETYERRRGRAERVLF